MKVSEVSVCINLHFNPVFMVHQFNGALSIKKTGCVQRSTPFFSRFFFNGKQFTPRKAPSLIGVSQIDVSEC